MRSARENWAYLSALFGAAFTEHETPCFGLEPSAMGARQNQIVRPCTRVAQQVLRSCGVE